jgi:hypothetical protein
MSALQTVGRQLKVINAECGQPRNAYQDDTF